MKKQYQINKQRAAARFEDWAIAQRIADPTDISNA